MLSPRFIQDARKQAYAANDLRVVVELAQMQAAHEDIRGAIETLRGASARRGGKIAEYTLSHLRSVANALEKHESHVRRAMRILDESPHFQDLKKFDLNVSEKMKEDEPVLGIILAEQLEQIINGEEIPDQLKEGFEHLFEHIKADLRQKGKPQTQEYVNRRLREIAKTVRAQALIHPNQLEHDEFIHKYSPYHSNAENKQRALDAIANCLAPILDKGANMPEVEALLDFFHDYNYYYYRVKRLGEKK